MNTTNEIETSEQREARQHAEYEARRALELAEKRTALSAADALIAQIVNALAQLKDARLPGIVLNKPARREDEDCYEFRNFGQAGTVEGFSADGGVSVHLRISEGWAILTATRECVGDGTHPENEANNARLARELTGRGFSVTPLSGFYKGIDQGLSFLVAGISAAEALNIGREWGQESVLVPAGLLYTDGTLNPAVPAGTVVGPAAESLEFFSRFSNGLAFSLGLDFSARVPFRVGSSPVLALASQTINQQNQKIL